MALQFLLHNKRGDNIVGVGPTARPACRPAVFRTAVPETRCTDQLFCTTKAANLLLLQYYNSLCCWLLFPSLHHADFLIITVCTSCLHLRILFGIMNSLGFINRFWPYLYISPKIPHVIFTILKIFTLIHLIEPLFCVNLYFLMALFYNKLVYILKVR